MSDEVGEETRFDAIMPREMAQRAEQLGVSKVRLDFWSLLLLSILAGAFIAMGAQLATIVVTHSGLGYGLNRLAMGVAFSLGLTLVIVAGAELFTGNNLIVMSWASRKVSTLALLRNWAIVYVGNFLGALATVVLLLLSQQWVFDGAAVGATALNIALAKVNLDFFPALLLGIFCNALVCLAVWMCHSARSTTDKILSLFLPITAFVASGFEHSIANMYFVPMGLFLKGVDKVVAAAGLSAVEMANLTWQGFVLRNLLPVTLGNIIGGSVMVGFVYWVIYLRRQEAP